ncbi:MAG: N-acetylmuramoyl-L-alanine amidase-like domain-containing protein, partial [Gemmatimonadota bacterium]
VDITPEDSVIFRETMAWAAEAELDTVPLGSAVVAFGRRFVGAPYIPGSLEPPGPERLVVNLRSFDCVTFLESALALARIYRAGKPTLDAYTRELARIRYRTGVPAGYPSRLHYFSDWIASNDERGLVENVTRELGGVQDEEPINFMTLHPDAYRQLEDEGVLQEIREMEATLNTRPRWVIPQERIEEVADGIQDGDIIAASSTQPGLDIAHTGIAIWQEGRLHLMHAPLVGDSVEISPLPLAQRLQNIQAQDGIMVARPR